MQEHTLIVVVSIATAGLTMALGAIGAAIGESRIASAAMDALAQAAGRIFVDHSHALREPGDGRIDGHFLPGHRSGAVVCESVCRVIGRSTQAVSPRLVTFLYETLNFAVLGDVAGVVFFQAGPTGVGALSAPTSESARKRRKHSRR